ncbi:EAL domain-containing protein [Klebsiella michiganensis]|uniref:EAL domain-containing protein n=1 Tax=Klebsiella michiganensis TaxID=1134687 RepID=UPI001597B09B|nr:EAL domain-containing protein [Klebsiella michiganensis]MDG9772300.1 EAL domain-containing protein [Klebsiella michiganensis]MDH0949359.1 EAL domain-containing protein [Klebsiella michiganensis]MDH1033968.1 EAL domain-containing protein [Klebsiella michiganensis]MDH1831723.1 EAL domain-containing protein [Klebsiella michiganensis]MDH1836642.1 EAL domain-containing protein [Klebsiella michiganensis]
MTTRHQVSLVTGVLILAIILPVALSIWLAMQQAKEQFYSELDNFSVRVLARVQQVADQAREALNEADAHAATNCSPQHLLTMRRIAYTHRYVQEVLWLHEGIPQCSSLEDHQVSVTFPAPDHITADGYRTWLTSVNDLGLKHKMTAMGSEHHVVMIDPVSFIDVIPLGHEEIHTLLFGTQRDQIIISSKPLNAAVWEKIKHQYARTLTLDSTVYRLHRLPELGLAIATWSSTVPLQKKLHQQLMLWLPIGLFTSLLASFLLLRLLRRLRSPRNGMLDALNSHAIQVYYQPIISLQSGKIVGAEALARWRQPDGSFLSPDIFIPLAEQTGLITRLTEDIVRKIFTELGTWLRQRPEIHISINLSVDDLRSPRLPMLLQEQLQRWGISAQQIILEITERGFVDPQTTLPVIAGYRQAGHRISIDDFGTGYSSLSYLQKLDVDTLKIDKAFVDTLECESLTPHIIEMAKALNLATVAEGVETESQRDWLRMHGVLYAQGWLYSKALPKEKFILWAENNLKAYSSPSGTHDD